MPIVLHVTVVDNYTQKDGRRYIRHEFTDHLGDAHKSGSHKVDGAWTETEYAAERAALIPAIESNLANLEVSQQIEIASSGGNPDKVAEHQTQADFDRRFLGRSMLLDAQPFFNCKPVFDRVQTEGANANQRAAYLNVTPTEYGLVNTRYENVAGIEWFLNDEKNQQWESVNEVFI